MKIAILSRYQAHVQRGVESFVYELSNRLSLSDEVDVISGSESDQITKLIKKDYDIIMPMNGRLQSLKVSLGRILGKYKLIIGGHSGIGRDDIFNIVIAKPDVFVALTEFQADWAKKFAWGSKIVVIPNGIDLDKFKPKGNKINLDLEHPVVLSVGALVWYKNHEKLINAMTHVKLGSLLIVGEGSDKEVLESLGKEKLGARFKIITTNYSNMPDIYRSSDLFTLPSWKREAFGIVYLEAMATGLGVVAPDDASRREIIGNAGLFVNVSDSVSYGEAIEKALTLNWKNKALNQAKKFSWDKVSKEYEKIFKDCLD